MDAYLLMQKSDTQESSMSNHTAIKRILLIAGMLVIAACCFVVFAERAHAETAGQDLIVRIGYFGDENDYREKATLTNSQLQGLGMQCNYYTNLTRVGTIMYMAAEGPTIKSVIDAAGVDINSVQTIHIRTTDGAHAQSRFISFPADSYMMETRYYYPNINGKWERVDSESEDTSGIPLEGALADAQPVETILAVRSYATKRESEAKDMESLKAKMSSDNSYRLCAGQKQLTEGVQTQPGQVTSSESAYWIFGIDLQLYGSPPENVTITGSLKNLKVGSKQTLHISGTDFFGEEFTDGDVTWESSNTKVATIGKTDGVLEIKGEGKTRITATVQMPDGSQKSSSVVINTKHKAGSKQQEKKKDEGDGKKKDDDKTNAAVGGTDKNDNDKNKPEAEVPAGKKLTCREVAIDLDQDVVYDRNEMSDDAIALAKEEIDPAIMAWAAVVAITLFLLGSAVRLRQYRREV